jgi:hypothetical protein
VWASTESSTIATVLKPGDHPDNAMAPSFSLTTSLVQALVMAGLTSAGPITVGAIYILSAIRGLADALDMPTRQASWQSWWGPRTCPTRWRSAVVFMTTCNIRLQLHSPAHLRGRMMSLCSLLFVGTTPISSLLIGFLAEKTGVRQSILEMSALCLLGVLIGFAYARCSQVLSLPDLIVRAPAKPSGLVPVEATESEGRGVSRGRETS